MNDERGQPPPQLRPPFPEGPSETPAAAAAPPEPARPADPPRPEILPGQRGRGGEGRPRRERGPRPELAAPRAPVLRESGGFRLRLEPPDLARLRELPGARGKTDEELGIEFLDTQQARLLAAVAGDVAPPAELRVLVDPYSRQAFLALERRIKGIVSF
ncbi:MAG: hypothetical protein ABR576_05410 [Thermoanaerobaculia bacterium]